MPTPAQHRAKAVHNESFAANSGDPFWDWAITGIFYAALQYVEAYLASQVPPVHPPTHQIRDSHIHRDRNLSPIYVDYRELQDESRDARYDAAATFSQGDFTRLQKNVNRIRQTIISLL
jgi:hypothetical protein